MGERSHGFQHEIAATLAKKAECLTILQRYDEALDCCEKSLPVALHNSNKLESGRVYAILAEIHASKGFQDYDKAEAYFEQALKAFHDAGAESDIGRAYLAGARVAIARNDVDSAKQRATKAKRILTKHGRRFYLKQIEELIGNNRDVI